MPPTENVLVAMEYGPRRSQLTAGLMALGLEPVEAGDCAEARRVLAGRHAPRLIVSDVSFRDGDWRDMLAMAQRGSETVSFMVSAPFPDYELWSEALWRGAYDLLVEPYSSGELRRIIDGALRAQSLASRPHQAMAEAV